MYKLPSMASISVKSRPKILRKISIDRSSSLSLGKKNLSKQYSFDTDNKTSEGTLIACNEQRKQRQDDQKLLSGRASLPNKTLPKRRDGFIVSDGESLINGAATKRKGEKSNALPPCFHLQLDEEDQDENSFSDTNSKHPLSSSSYLNSSWLTPSTASNKNSSRMMRIQNISSSSIDSGVSSPYASKKTSMESVVSTEKHRLLQEWTADQIQEHTDADSDGIHKGNRDFRWGRSDSQDEVGKRKAILSDSSDHERDDDGDSFFEGTPFCFNKQQKPKELSVNVDAFADLLQAAMRLIDDVKPVEEAKKSRDETPQNEGRSKGSLIKSKRRSSCWENTIPKPEAPKLRKVSASPILQRNFSTGGGSKNSSKKEGRVSACIMCERNNRVKDNGGSNVVIKTSMIRTLQKRRRYSEVLKVYKPGDIPYTEFVLPHISDLRSSTEAAEELGVLVDKNMPTFVRLTSWNSLYAHLVSNELLDADMREFIISSTPNIQKGNKFYGEYMPSVGSQGYKKLRKCFREEKDHLGHRKLANLMNGGTRSIKTL